MSYPVPHLITPALVIDQGANTGFAPASLFLPVVDIAELFRRTVIEAFVEQELLPEEVARNMFTWPHSGFHVHVSSRLLPDDGGALGATARYAARAPISLSRLHYDGEEQVVTYRYTSACDHREHVERLLPHEFIARLASYIPGRYERLIRYYGLLLESVPGSTTCRDTRSGDRIK